jgi:hypothetical protein
MGESSSGDYRWNRTLDHSIRERDRPTSNAIHGSALGNARACRSAGTFILGPVYAFGPS